MMKEIERRKIEGQVREELREAKEFCSYDHGRYYTMMIDLSDATIWADCFLDCNSWKEYRSDDIVRLSTDGMFDHTVGAYTDDAIQKLTEAGWTIKN